MKKKQTHRHREETSGYQQGEGRVRGKTGIGDYEVQATSIK